LTFVQSGTNQSFKKVKDKMPLSTTDVETGFDEKKPAVPRQSGSWDRVDTIVETWVPGMAGVMLFCFLLGVVLFGVFAGGGIPGESRLEYNAEVETAQQSVAEAAHILARRQDCNETVYESNAAAVTAPTVTAPTVATSTTAVVTIVNITEASGTAAATVASTPSSSASTTTGLSFSLPSSIMSFSTLVSSIEGVSVPISTHTAISVIYSFVTTPEAAPTTTTSLSQYLGECTCAAVTETVSVIVTLVPTTLDDATVTAIPSTLTNVNTDVSYTQGPPEVTVSGNPSTLTEVQTDVSFTSGLPDATISGTPATVTNVETDVSLTSGFPDATVSGTPVTVTDVDTKLSLTEEPTTTTVMYQPPQSTVTMTTIVIISDLWGPVATSTRSTVTAVTTAQRTITTVYSSLWTVVITEAGSTSTSTASTQAQGFSSEADGVGIPGSPSATTPEAMTQTTLTTTVSSAVTVVLPPAPYPTTANGTASTLASGTFSYIVPTATSTVIVSRGHKAVPVTSVIGFSWVLTLFFVAFFAF
jgi:hypothetical protein